MSRETKKNSNEIRFTCGLEHGIHARPASVLAEALRPFAARVDVIKEESGASADVRSVLSVVALNVAHGNTCVIRAEGNDASVAIDALRTIVEQEFGEAKAEARATAARDDIGVPAGLRQLGVRWIVGRGISPGFAQGPVAMANQLAHGKQSKRTAKSTYDKKAVHRALHQVRQNIEARLDTAGSDLERELLRAHMSIAEDPALRERIDEAMLTGAAPADAVRQAGAHFAQTLRASASAYVRERAIDVEDVCQQILEQLGEASAAVIELKEPSIVIADLLTPRQMMQMDRSKVLGLVLGRVGATSHTAILARSFGIPTLIDVHDAQKTFKKDHDVIVDANGGFVLPEVTAEIQRYYAIEKRSRERHRTRLGPFIKSPAKSRDGRRLEIGANVSTPDEVAHAIDRGAEGIGLFRTEMLFLDRAAPPNEAEQYIAYARAVEAADGRPVIIRTLDIGGDKPAPYLRLPREENPFLGWRGIRLYEHFSNILRDQLRAMVRASAKGPIKVMAPMVSNVSEATWFRQRVHEVQDELRKEKTKFDRDMPIGVMIEVPAAAMSIERLAGVADFFSVGTNDLTQYFMAADRGNPRVAAVCDPLEPAFVSLLRSIVDAAHRAERWVGVCGEMAGDLRNLPLMLGLGLDEISVSPAHVLDLKAGLSRLDFSACREFVERSLTSHDANQVRALLNQCAVSGEGSAIIEPGLVINRSDARSKVEAIKELCGLIASAGRAASSHAIENAVWAREETYSTGLGFGFAIPHCKSDAVHAATIAVLGLENPIDWGSTDGQSVSVVIMLAIPDAGAAAETARQHMQVLAGLARKLMHEDFRARIVQAKTPKAVVDAISAGMQTQ